MKIGIISDIHEDAQRLDLAFKRLEKAGATEIACLGDMVGFDVLTYRYLSSRNASYCLDMIRSGCRWVVAGNHDLYAIRKIPDLCSLFRFPDNWYDLDFSERKSLSENRVWLYEHRELPALLKRSDRDYIDSLPLHLQLDCDGLKIVLSHSLHPDLSGSLALRPRDPWDYRPHLSWLKTQTAQIGVSGHLHLSGLFRIDSRSVQDLNFSTSLLKTDLAQYICPATASSSSKNGVLLLDTVQRSIQALPLKSSRYLMNCFQ